MSNIPNLASLARLRLWSWGWSTVRRKAFWFDWVNDYISSNDTIGRTGYDMNVSGNVTTGSDADGSHIWINWNRDQTAWTWTRAQFWTNTTPVFNQWNSLTIKAKVKFNSFVANNVGGIFGSAADFAMHIESSTNKVRYTVRWSTNVNVDTASALSLNTLYDLYLAYDSSNSKFYAYISTAWWASTLINAWGTTWPATFSTDARQLWDWAIGAWNASSQSMYIYHACIRNKALTQAEIDADIALWNTTKQDPSIVAYYVPDNLQFNTDYITTKDFSNVARTKTGTTVTSWIADIRWWANAYTLTMSAGAGNGATITNNTVTLSSLASKTFIMKVFAWTASWTATMRLRISHNGVSTYYSADQTVTTTPQEFTFTQALTSSTSGTWMTYWIEVWSAAWAATINVFYPTDWLVNQTLRDESPNIGGYIGRKTQKVLSCRVKPNIDAANTVDAQMLMLAPRALLHIRNTLNTVRIRNDTRLRANEPTYNLWTGFRDKVHILWVQRITWGNFQLELFVNWETKGTATHLDAPTTNYSNVLWAWRRGSTYYSWNERDIREYTFTWSFTDADALAIYNWWEPTSAWVTKYLHYRPPVGEVGTTTQDQSPNDRDWTLNNGVTRNYI